MTLSTNNPHEFAVCMGMDAMRLCLGIPPRNFATKDVIRWLRLMSRAALTQSNQADERSE